MIVAVLICLLRLLVGLILVVFGLVVLLVDFDCLLGYFGLVVLCYCMGLTCLFGCLRMLLFNYFLLMLFLGMGFCYVVVICYCVVVGFICYFLGGNFRGCWLGS